MKEWMTDCTRNHKTCPRPGRITLPRRLVQISPPSAAPSARLYETTFSHSKLNFMALSYCWGGAQVHVTTHANFAQYSKTLPYDVLSQTILNSFTVACNLGCEFIWIDSLCIIQDDVDDINREISKMRHIYQNAALTISASRAASPQDGFLSQDFNPLKLFSLPCLPDEAQVPFVVSDSSFMYDVLISRSLLVNARS